MKQRNSLTSNNKQTGRRPADMLDIYKLICLIWPVWSLQQDWKISNEGLFFRFSWDRQKLLVTLPRWRSLCHSLARDQPQPGSFFQRLREAEKRDPGNEVGDTELARAVDVVMARARRICKVNKLFSFFSSWCFLKEVENMYSVFLSSYTNTRESLGELEKAVEHSPAVHLPTAYLVLPNFHSCLYNSIETRYVFSIS